MQPTLTKQADPHDVFLIESVLAACAKLSSQEPVDRTVSPPLAPQVQPHVQMASAIAAGASVPTVDTTFRATAVDAVDIPQEPFHDPLGRPQSSRWIARTSVGFVFAIVSAVAAAAWQHYGDAATQTITRWTPSFAFASSSTPAPAAADQDAAPVNQASALTEAPAQPQPAQDNVPAAVAPEPAQLPPSVARDIAAMGQQIEDLKASIEQLKAGQEQLTKQMSRDVAARTPEPKVSEPPARAKLSALPPRSTVAPVRKPPRTPYPYPPAQTAAAPPTPIAPPLPPATAAMPPPPSAAPQPMAQPDDEPVIRPPMPLR